MSADPVEIDSGVTTRRQVLAGAGAVGATALLAACGTEPDGFGGTEAYGPPGDDPPAGQTSEPTEPPEEEEEEPEEEPEQEEPAADALASTGDIPVGGGVVLADQELVVTQPTAGQFVGFSAICTHQGCTVVGVSDGTINCNCHGSRFSIADGSVQAGPAPQPLPARNVAVEGDSIVLA